MHTSTALTYPPIGHHPSATEAAQHAMYLLNFLRPQVSRGVCACLATTPTAAAAAAATTIARVPRVYHNALIHARRISTEAAQARKKTVALYPARINIYRSGVAATLSVGVTRVATLVVLVLGSAFYGPSFYFSAAHSSWWAPAFALASGVPFIVTALATGPMVHGVRVWLPQLARRSKDELKRFSRVTPADTMLELQYMRWLPWPQTRHIRFSQLERLRPSWSSFANLEHIPALSDIELMRQKWSYALVRRWMGSFYVNRHQKRDRAAVPGVFDAMWEQIPMQGDRRCIKVAQAKQPLSLHNGPVIKPLSTGSAKKVVP